jgi:hypothetical protein
MGCRFDAYKYAMNNIAIVRRLQIKIFVAKVEMPRDGWQPIGHCKCNRMVKVDNHLVLTVMSLGAIVDLMLAILALLLDQAGVMFPWRGNDLYFDPETKELIHFSQIDEQIPYCSQAAVIQGGGIQ